MNAKNPYAAPVDQYILDAQARTAAESEYWRKFYRRLDVGHAILTGCLVFMGVLLAGWILFGIIGITTGYITFTER